MPLKLVNLDNQTRPSMIQEIDQDISADKLYISPRLTPEGSKDYPQLLKSAAEKYDDSWLAQQLKGKFKSTEQRQMKDKTINAKVPENANEMLAEGEFNRFYLRGLCVRAEKNGIKELVVYRAKPVTNPRPESEAKIGAKVDAAVLLKDLREHRGIDTALGLPAGPNSGLSAKLP